MKYKKSKKNKTDFIFPLLCNALDFNNPWAVDNALSSATAFINKNLKHIAKKGELNKSLSFHISRHTWATRALRKGMSFDKVSKIIVNSNLKQTQKYAKTVSSELDKAMDVFND